MPPVFIIAIIFSYLIGSIPFGLLITAAHGKDLRKIGSGNIGATNVARAIGKKWAYICFVLDLLKGLVPMLLIQPLAEAYPGQTQTEYVTLMFLWLAIGCAAIIGHIFPIYLKFKGGKGVATSFGVALGLWPYFTISALFAVCIWLVVVLIWRYVSLASIVASVAFPIFLFFAISLRQSWHFASLWPLVVASVAIPLMVIIRHRENIKRLLSGTEHKILQKKSI
jgi:acyl phosphate:glycerol-3-phosphate acyltransferase